MPDRGKRPHRSGVGVGAAPAVAFTKPDQPLPQHSKPRVGGRSQGHGARHLREAARFGRQDSGIGAFARKPAIDLAPIAGEQA